MFDRAKLVILVVLVVLFAGATAVGLDVVSWREMPRREQAAIRVGDPELEKKKCCLKGTYTPCGYECVKKINCPPGVKTTGTCTNPSCIAAPDDDFKCSPPNLKINFSYNICKTTGKAPPCETPDGTNKCELENAVDGIFLDQKGCNAGVSLCMAQPMFPCEK